MEEDREEDKIEYLPLKERVKFSENLPNGEIKRKSPVLHKIILRNYVAKLSASISCCAKVFEL